MNTERLLQHYEQIADAPDAIARLRRFILDLAVRGKLVPQHPMDEPASELLKRIIAEKERLAKAGEIRKPKALEPVDQPPFELPHSWNWVRIRQVTSDRGQEVPTDAFTYIDVGAINKEEGVVGEPSIFNASEAPSRARKVVRRGDVIYSCVRPYLLNIAVIDTDFVPKPIASTAFAVLNGHGYVVPRYIWTVLRSPFMVECVEETQRGLAYPAINDADFAVLPFPLPPLAEQHRIVAKVNELMALCDELEAARTEREMKRDRLAAASLARLNTPDPEIFRDDARFALDALPALTARPDQIKQLRQTILNLAVRGKLVPQDPADEPAGELLKRIQRARVVEGKASRQVAIEDTNALSGPRPRGWVTTAVQHVSEVGTGSTPTSTDSSYYANGSIPWLTSSSSGLDEIASAENFVTEKAVSDFRLKVYPPGSLLVALYGQGKTRGQVAKLAINAAVNQACAVITWIEGFEDLCHFLFIVFKQQYHEMRLKAEGGAQPNLNLRKIKELRFDLPPLAEQHRIVAKVDELMALCDELETSLTSADETRKKLLDALLAEALAPVDAEALQEAAE